LGWAKPQEDKEDVTKKQVNKGVSKW